MSIPTQDTNSGRFIVRGFPYWKYIPYDDRRTIKIKAAKNIISLMAEIKDIDASEVGPDEIKSYEHAIRILKEEGEKYPS